VSFMTRKQSEAEMYTSRRTRDEIMKCEAGTWRSGRRFFKWHRIVPHDTMMRCGFNERIMDANTKVAKRHPEQRRSVTIKEKHE
jgi:hypothetical protein